MKQVIGIVTQDYKKIESCFKEVLPQMYKDLHKTKHGRKLINIVSLSEKEIMNIGLDNMVSMIPSKSQFRKEFKGLLEKTDIWNRIVIDIFETEMKTYKDSIIIIHITSIELLELARKNGKVVFVSEENKPVNKKELGWLKWKAIKQSWIGNINLEYNFTDKDYWYYDNKPVNYMKSFVVDYTKENNPYFS